MSKLNYVRAFLFKPSIYCCKAVLLVFYGELQPRGQHPKMWWCICTTWVLCVIGCFFQIFMNITACWPFHLNWSWTRGECGYRPEFMISSMVLHTLTDVLVYSIPIAILHNLKNLTRRQRHGAMSMFAVGGISVGFALLSAITYGMPEYLDPDTWQRRMEILSNVNSWGFEAQYATAKIVVCMPQVRRLYQIIYAERNAQRRENAGIDNEIPRRVTSGEDFEDIDVARLSSHHSATTLPSKTSIAVETVVETNGAQPGYFNDKNTSDVEKAA